MASYMKAYTAYEDVVLSGGGTGMMTHSLYARLGILAAQQIIRLTPVGALHVIPPALAAVQLDINNAAAIVGSANATVRVVVQAVHSINQ